MQNNDFLFNSNNNDDNNNNVPMATVSRNLYILFNRSFIIKQNINARSSRWFCGEHRSYNAS